MFNQRVRFSAVLMPLVVLVFFLGCRPVRQLIPVVPDRAVEQVLTSMHASQASFDFFSARFSGRASINGSETALGGTIRIRKDSAIFVSVAPVLGIEVARILVTPGHVKMLNRLEGTYFDGDMQVVNSMLNADVDFYMLQSLLLGSDFAYFSADNFRLSNERDMLKLHNPARRQLRSPEANAATITHSLWLDPQSYRIMQSNIADDQGSRTVQASYPSHTTVQGQTMPSEVLITFIDGLSRADLNLSYNRITLNQPQQMTFSVPSRYRPMDF